MFCLQVAGMLAAGTLACWLAFFIFMAANTRPPHAIDPDMGKQSTAQINMHTESRLNGAEGHHFGAILAQKADTEGGQTGQAT